MDLKTAPKQFCENIVVGTSPEFFVIGMLVGGTGTAYAVTPQHAKRLHQYLEHNIKEYEKQHGKIDAEWNPNVPSQVQMDADANSGGAENGDKSA